MDHIPFHSLHHGLQDDVGPSPFGADVRSTYIANTTVSGFEKADMILLIGTNPRVESPVFNARLRKTWLDGTQVEQDTGLMDSRRTCLSSAHHQGQMFAYPERVAGLGLVFNVLPVLHVLGAHLHYLQIALLGEAVDLTYRYEHLGSDPAALASLSTSPFVEKLKAAKNPAIVVGPGVCAFSSMGS
jgi:NADH dehydrogenase (ubiquinone) Fe-S protein 1